MEILAILSLVAAVGLAAVCLWLMAQRGRLLAQAAAAESAKQAAETLAEREREAARAIQDRAEAEARGLRGERDELVKRVTEMEGLVREAKGRVEQESAHARALIEEARRGYEARERELKEVVEQTREKAKEAFGSLAAEALRTNTEAFLRQAEQRLATEREKSSGEMEKKRVEIASLVAPIGDVLKRADEKLGAMQQQWASDRSEIAAQIASMATAGETLRSETGRLVKALSRPEVRGRYGEIQLRRVAELAGMTAYCDFAEQETSRDDEGRASRPDMVVKLPNERVIAIDAKTNTYAYVEAVNAQTQEEREAHLDRFVRHVADQVQALSRKQYWTKFEGSPEFVVMFMPGDAFLDAALARRPGLIEEAAAANVLITTPATLIGLLRAVAVGWREQKISEQAKELFDLGRQLHERAANALEKLADVGEAIEKAAKKYNEFVGSYESRFEPVLRKFEEAGVKSGKTLPDFEQVEVRIKQLPVRGETTGG